MKNAGKARSYGLYRHLRTSKEIIENLLNYSAQKFLYKLFKLRFKITVYKFVNMKISKFY